MAADLPLVGAPSVMLTQQFRVSERAGMQALARQCRRNVRLAAIPSVVASATEQPKLTSDSFVRPHLRKLSAYTPIEPFEILSKKLGRKPEDIIKLDANENPYGPPPEVVEALGSLSFPNIYPDPESRQLREALAEDVGVPMEAILTGAGADELIDLLMRCVLDPGDCIVNCSPTFGMYSFDAAVNDARTIDVPRADDFSIDVDGIIAACKEHKPKIVFLTSPNNPDGCMIKEEELLRVLELPVLVCLDEAYIEFSTEESRSSWVLERENLCVLRTFSKRAGLAGMRVGYGIFPSGLIEYLWRAKQPYNVSVAADVAACAALSNPTYLKDVRDALVEERGNLMKMLQDIPYLSPYPSHANFILCRVEGRDAKALKDTLAENGIMVRYYSSPEVLAGCVRISVGKPEQTAAIEKVLKSLV
mmetsp:Transcript_35133/g.76785  ORF Transcript_35133/g.76785 Transcript_35133/m.76785 type:complete len:419 (-) Transcript_35133:183-1439(-)|eukprot:CAMPEP_0118938022 /NCGR_PEP_ID=MMETSP1169-20130426/24548_1 /TAXON_ID=36882 /ORGANISM="Pyramimonas obovata, Strain CCMP722" /LENGTH=418 /DNA_ID=CAMNT_0006881845 /DNA_START=90 /DNA_END=1346 /DNA_ORIENTATION=+